MPGIAASTSETWLLGSPPNSVDAPENSFALEVTCAWTSMPTMISHSPVAPFTSFLRFGSASIMILHRACAAAAFRSGEPASQQVTRGPYRECGLKTRVRGLGADSLRAYL